MKRALFLILLVVSTKAAIPAGQFLSRKDLTDIELNIRTPITETYREILKCGGKPFTSLSVERMLPSASNLQGKTELCYAFSSSNATSAIHLLQTGEHIVVDPYYTAAMTKLANLEAAVRSNTGELSADSLVNEMARQSKDFADGKSPTPLGGGSIPIALGQMSQKYAILNKQDYKNFLDLLDNLKKNPSIQNELQLLRDYVLSHSNVFTPKESIRYRAYDFANKEIGGRINPYYTPEIAELARKDWKEKSDLCGSFKNNPFVIENLKKFISVACGGFPLVTGMFTHLLESKKGMDWKKHEGYGNHAVTFMKIEPDSSGVPYFYFMDSLDDKNAEGPSTERRLVRFPISEFCRVTSFGFQYDSREKDPDSTFLLRRRNETGFTIEDTLPTNLPNLLNRRMLRFDTQDHALPTPSKKKLVDELSKTTPEKE